MAFAGLEHDVVSAMRAAEMSPQRVLLLQLVLRGVHPWARGAAHASALGTCAAGASRARLVLEAHAATAQPAGRLVREVCGDASAGVAALRAVLPGEAALRHLQRALDEVPARLSAAQDQKAARLLSARVSRHGTAVPPAVHRLFASVWDDRSSDVRAATAAAETAAVLLLAGRDYDELVLDLKRLLRQGDPSGEAAWSTLLPAERPFLAGCLVEGTRGLQGLPGLLPGARQCDAADADGVGWTAGAARLRAYAASRAPAGRLVCLVTAEVAARDRAAAGWRLRRDVAEVLDQYVAGHRLADLRLLPETLVAESDGTRHAEITARAPSVRTAYPLTRDWPAPMRESLRTAHLARTTDSPVARSALAWSAIESLGVLSVQKHPGDTTAVHLSAALALHHLRDRTMETHRAIKQAARAETAAAQAAETAAAARLRAVLASAADGAKKPGPGGATALAQAVAEARAASSAAGARASNLRGVLPGALASLDAYVAVHAGSGLLAGANEWVRVLSPTRRGDPPELLAAHRAVDGLAAAVGGSAAIDVRRCRELYADDAALADELDRLQARGKGSLDWLYAARNLSLHNGVFALEGDGPLLAVGALNQLDATLEVLGNWFAHEEDQPRRRRAARKASAAVKVLAERKDATVAVLRSGRRRRRLDVGELTSPRSRTWLPR